MSIDAGMKKRLLEEAAAAGKNAYARYSGYSVGAAILTDDGKIFTGCNVENASYGGTICAERCAAVKAVSEGCTHFRAIAVSAEGSMPYPCGICRQFLSEFADGDIEVFMEGGKGGRSQLDSRLSELLPYGFSLETETK
jgi:cytidine deaminase